MPGFVKEEEVGSGRLFLGVELSFARLFRAGLLGAVELQDRRDAYFPNALVAAGLLIRALAAPQFALDGQVSALLQGLRVVGEFAPDDAAMPLGVAVVFAGLLVLVGTLGGKREDGEVRAVGCVGAGVLSEESDERDAVLLHGESPLVNSRP